MSETMKAAVAREFGGPLNIEEVPRPTAGPNEVVVKVSYCGVCHSDVHLVNGDFKVPPPLPLIPGHEATGTVAEVGPGVTHVQAGDAVGVPWLNSTCGNCECCMTGWENMCKLQAPTGYAVPGGFAEYVKVSGPFCTPLPEGADPASIAPILCAGLTVYKGLKVSEARPGEWVAVSGVGGLGQLAIQYAKAMGMNVAAIDISDEKLQLAKDSGADIAVNGTDPAAGKVIRKACGGAHGVLVTAVATAAYQQALGMLRTRGTLVMLSLPEGNLEVPIVASIGRGLTIRGSAVGNRQDLREALQFAASGKVKSHVTVQDFDTANDVITGLREGTVTGRVVLNIGG